MVEFVIYKVFDNEYNNFFLKKNIDIYLYLVVESRCFI